MSADKLIQYIEEPDRLNAMSLARLEEWIEQYPFFQTAHLLRVKNLQNLHDKIDKQVLNLTAAYVGDRKVLYYLLHKFHETQEAPAENAEEARLHDKDIKDSMQENISDTITRQVDIYSMEPGHEIELIPGLAIDVRKEYGDGVEFDEFDNFFANTRNLKQSELLEIADETETVTEADHQEAEIQDDQQEDSFTFDLDIEEEETGETVSTKQPIEDQPHAEKEVYNSEEELDRQRSRSFTDWLDHINSTESREEEPIPREKPVREEIPLERPYDLRKLVPDTGGTGDTASPSPASFSLIDKFIQENPRILPLEKTATNEDMSAESIKEHESFFTDTLAKIYIKQGNYAKAIFAYEKLSLKYPEKSTYFAGQISKIKKLIHKS
ncbi:MAG: tetratricopeptide repeat protein [Bacteroidales bacterium]|nr:tetratricopeptide repeat protein [Bacteroidales bacterium]